MRTEYMAPDWEQLLYQYCQEHGGYFVGNPLNDERYPECQLVLDLDKVPIIVSALITSSSQYGVSMCSIAQIQAKLQYPYHLDIKPMNLLRKGLDIVMKEDIEIHDKALDKKYLICSDNPDFTKLILPGSSLGRLLLLTKEYRIKVSPMGDEKQLHTVQAVCSRNIEGALIGKQIDMESLTLLIDLCRETYLAITQYPMPEPEPAKDFEE